MKEEISDDTMYGRILETKYHEQRQRDEINKYYTSLFTSMVAAIPIIDKFINPYKSEAYSLYGYLPLLTLATIGIAVSISWMQALRRIYSYIEAYDRLLIKLEERYNKEFQRYVALRLDRLDAPDRITKQVMYLPMTFLIIFSAIFAYEVKILWENLVV